MAWYDSAVFYHIYPLGLCGSKHENTGEAENHFDKLKEWADHACKMNFTAIYIGPLFESVGHGYETTDYKKVDCRIGTNPDFKEYVKYCHKLGIKVIVDGVFNHVGREFFAFKDVKEKRENSPYCGWFCNLNFGGNNEYNDGFSYENWGGYNLLVKLNQRNPEVQNYIFDVIRFWVSEFDIDGIRLDAADVLDFDFMKAMRHVANEVKPDFWLMGEVIHGDYSRWANEDTLHSVTNYELHKGLFSGHNDHNYFEIAHSIKRLNDICRGKRLYTFLDNHDVARIASKLNNKEHLSLVTILLYTVYGIPSVYYGSEFAIEGDKQKESDWNLRPALELKDYADAYDNNPVTELCMKLGALKKTYPELSDGKYQELVLTNRQFAFGRVLDNSAVIVALNNDDAEATVEINAPVNASKAVDLLGNAKTVNYSNGHLQVVLGANSGTVLFVGEREVKVDATKPVSKEETAKKEEKIEAATEKMIVETTESLVQVPESEEESVIPKKPLKVLVLNGSPHEEGSTATALKEAIKSLNAQGIETEIVQVGSQPIRGCMACSQCSQTGKCVVEDLVNEVAPKFEEADGLLVGAPVYYASANATLVAFMTRLFCSTKFDKAMKVGGAVVSARRGGLSSSFDELNKFFTISGMPVVSSMYWNSIHGNNAEEARQDAEGLQTMRVLGQNMGFLIKSIALGKSKYGLPEKEQKIKTNFTR